MEKLHFYAVNIKTWVPFDLDEFTKLKEEIPQDIVNAHLNRAKAELESKKQEEEKKENPEKEGIHVLIRIKRVWNSVRIAFCSIYRYCGLFSCESNRKGINELNLHL